tara:strand:+ start:515 stop:721 length:207 start_codon:yes stop_codon:yes gene_type:complete
MSKLKKLQNSSFLRDALIVIKIDISMLNDIIASTGGGDTPRYNPSFFVYSLGVIWIYSSYPVVPEYMP